MLGVLAAVTSCSCWYLPLPLLLDSAEGCHGNAAATVAGRQLHLPRYSRLPHSSLCVQDPNTGKKMLESDAIIAYLFEQYGDGKVCKIVGQTLAIDACWWLRC